jgi:hypothetical protein
LISTHAEAAAMQVAIKILAEREYPSFSGYASDLHTKISQQDIYDWVKIYNIPDLPQPSHPEPFKLIDNVERNYNEWEYEKYREELYCYYDRLRDYANRVLEKLILNEHLDSLVDFPLLLDVSHILIWHQGNHRATEDTCKELLRSHQIVEIHLSHNQGIADTHDLIPVDIWFDRYIADWQARYFVTYESLPISLVSSMSDKMADRLTWKS